MRLIFINKTTHKILKRIELNLLETEDIKIDSKMDKSQDNKVIIKKVTFLPKKFLMPY